MNAGGRHVSCWPNSTRTSDRQTGRQTETMPTTDSGDVCYNFKVRRVFGLYSLGHAVEFFCLNRESYTVVNRDAAVCRSDSAPVSINEFNLS